MAHPAERIIEDALEGRERRSALDHLGNLCLDPTRPGLATSVLRCVGRRSLPGSISWRLDLVRRALTMADAGIRDAAAQAAERWGGTEMLRLLQEHDEPLPWLRRYIRDVIEDLAEQR